MVQIIGVVDRKKRNIVLFIFCITICSNCVSQVKTEKKEGISCCVENQLIKEGIIDGFPYLLDGSGNYSSCGYSIKIDNERLVLSGNLKEMEISKNESVKKWISLINTPSLKAYNITVNNKVFFIFSSEIIGATGIAVNFYQWLIIDASTFSAVSTSLLSLSDDPRMFFNKNGVLHITLFKFGDEFFLKNRDWVNPPIKILNYDIQGNALNKVSQIDTICKCQ